MIGLAVKLSSNGSIIHWSERVGLNNKTFIMPKFRTMFTDTPQVATHLLNLNESRITKVGFLLRKYSLDELPQLFSILKGDMSLVGPRPDVPGYADKLEGFDRRILELRPGITGPATLKYANEEQLLASIDDPEKYNDEVIFSDKVKMNLDYLDNWNL